MNKRVLKIGTRDSKLALWQAQTVQALLNKRDIASELVAVKSEGDLDLVTPLYAMGVEGVFSKTLDAYLLSNKIDIAVHSMKDVPTQLAQGIVQAATLKRASYKDLFVYKDKAIYEKYICADAEARNTLEGIVATGSVRRKAHLLHRYPQLTVENLRGNVQTRMSKLHSSNWDAAIFAAAGLERINERPQMASEINWMLPAPAQGVIMVVCREEDKESIENVAPLNDVLTAICAQIERDFLKVLMGGCSTPISALAEIKENKVHFIGNILSLDGKEKIEIEQEVLLSDAGGLGLLSGEKLLQKGADKIVESIRNNAQ